MKLKEIISILFLSLTAYSVQAQEDILQISPTQIEPGTKRASLEVQMNNTEAYLSLQFDLYLPKGIELIDGNKPYGSLLRSRFPYTEEYDEEEDMTTYNFKHALGFMRDEAFSRFVISPANVEIPYIKGNSGTLFRIYIKSDANIQPGIYPVIFKNVAFTGYDGKRTYSVRPPKSTSYIVVGSPAVESSLDLSSLEGYIPNDIAKGLNTWLADKPQITEVDLSGIDDAGQCIVGANPNMLYYTKIQSDFAAKENGQIGKNVVEGNTCQSFILTDGYPVSISKAFQASSALYERTVPAAGWYSLCLPFNADTEEAVRVERYSSLDAQAKTVTFKEGTVEANKPCIFNTASPKVSFTASHVTIEPTSENPVDGDFTGTYSKIKAGDIEGCYALFADGQGFGTAGSTAYVDPFRAYLNYSGSDVNTLRLIHQNEATKVSDTSDTDHLKITQTENGLLFKAGDKPESIHIFRLDGRKACTVSIQQRECKNIQLTTGVYIVNQIKFNIK